MEGAREEIPNNRVTNAQLKLELNLVRQEQKTEHMKTRLVMVILASPGIARALPYVLGDMGISAPW